VIELETLFSKTPFMNQEVHDFGFIEPYESEELPLDTNETLFDYPMDKDLAQKNLLVEVSNNECGVKKIKPYYSA